ncbi:MAG: GNAT family N-acetyltransferase [Deltaproteobacteria bacterium]|nr:GNAT family N-acetyltransferase [Deltaproteobacteria bacterium]
MKRRSAVKIKRVTSLAELVQALTIRIRVFVKEQRVPAEIELDAEDRHAIHFLAIQSGRAVGTARIVMKYDSAKIGRMAVLKSYRRKGVGAQLLKHALTTAQRLHARKIYLNAQLAVIGFYQRMGFRAVGKVFDEAGIAHRKMVFGGGVNHKGH